MIISFDQIPRGRRLPGSYIEIDSSRAVRGLPGLPHKVLALGQMLSTGNAEPLAPVLINDPEQAAAAFGRGSMLHAICTAFRNGNDSTEFWAMGLEDDGAGVAAVKSATVSKADAGADFGAGTAVLWTGGRRVRAGVAVDDTAAEIAAALVAAGTDPALPFILSIDPGTPEKILATARHKGAEGGDLDLRFGLFPDERAPANLRIAIAEETAGSGNPDAATALATVAGGDWTGIVFPWTDLANYTVLQSWLEDRFDALVALDTRAYTAKAGTVTQLFEFGEARNSHLVNTLPAMGSPTPSWEIAAAMAAVAEFQFQIDPVRQLRTLGLDGVLPGAEADRFTPDEKELLLHSGITAVDVQGGQVRIMRAVTNYQTSPLGAEDTAYLDLTTVSALAYLRWSETQRIELRFPRHKLASDGTRAAPGQAVATPSIIRGELIALYGEWETAGLVEEAQFFIDRLLVERDGDPNRLNSLQTPDIINNFRVFAARIQYRL